MKRRASGVAMVVAAVKKKRRTGGDNKALLAAALAILANRGMRRPVAGETLHNFFASSLFNGDVPLTPDHFAHKSQCRGRAAAAAAAATENGAPPPAARQEDTPPRHPRWEDVVRTTASGETLRLDEVD